MNLGDTFITIFVMILITSVLFIFPLMIISNQVDSASEVCLQNYMTDFVNEVCNTGKLTKDNYNKLIEKITGPNTYNIEIEIKILDENPNRKITQAEPTKIGEDVYVSYYTSQIVNQLDNNGRILLKEGDQVHVYIANTNTTLSQQLASYSIINNMSNIIAETTQVCTMNGF